MMDGVLKVAEISLSGLLKPKAALVGVRVYVKSPAAGWTQLGLYDCLLFRQTVLLMWLYC